MKTGKIGALLLSAAFLAACTTAEPTATIEKKIVAPTPMPIAPVVQPAAIQEAVRAPIPSGSKFAAPVKTITVQPTPLVKVEEPVELAELNCHPSYSGCLNPDAS